MDEANTGCKNTDRGWSRGHKSETKGTVLGDLLNHSPRVGQKLRMKPHVETPIFGGMCRRH